MTTRGKISTSGRAAAAPLYPSPKIDLIPAELGGDGTTSRGRKARGTVGRGRCYDSPALLKERPPVLAHDTPPDSASADAPAVRRANVLADYRVAVRSRQMSLLGRREVLTGKGKFGIFGDGK